MNENDKDHRFQRTVTIYVQNCEDFRSLNRFMWQIPVLAMTLTGGAWFGVTKAPSDPFVQFALYVIASFGNIAFIVALWRLRSEVMQRILEDKRKFENDEMAARSPDKRNYTVILWFSGVLLLASILSVVGAYKVAFPN